VVYSADLMTSRRRWASVDDRGEGALHAGTKPDLLLSLSGGGQNKTQRKRETRAGSAAQTPCRGVRACQRPSLLEQARANARPRSRGAGASRRACIEAFALIGPWRALDGGRSSPSGASDRVCAALRLCWSVRSGARTTGAAHPTAGLPLQPPPFFADLERAQRRADAWGRRST
jgi:hypothetical protein